MALDMASGIGRVSQESCSSLLLPTHPLRVHPANGVSARSFPLPCGAVLLGGSHPFQSENDYETARKIRSGKYVMERRVWRHVSEDAKVGPHPFSFITYGCGSGMRRLTCVVGCGLCRI